MKIIPPSLLQLEAEEFCWALDHRSASTFSCVLF